MYDDKLVRRPIQCIWGTQQYLGGPSNYYVCMWVYVYMCVCVGGGGGGGGESPLYGDRKHPDQQVTILFIVTTIIDIVDDVD